MGNGGTFSKPRYGSVIHLHTAVYRFTLKRKKKKIKNPTSEESMTLCLKLVLGYSPAQWLFQSPMCFQLFKTVNTQAEIELNTLHPASSCRPRKWKGLHPATHLVMAYWGLLASNFLWDLKWRIDGSRDMAQSYPAMLNDKAWGLEWIPKFPCEKPGLMEQCWL